MSYWSFVAVVSGLGGVGLAVWSVYWSAPPEAVTIGIHLSIAAVIIAAVADVHGEVINGGRYD